MATLRVGIVDYLNSRPLAWAFRRQPAQNGIEAVFRSPAEVADALAEARIDVGLIPSIEVQRIPGVTVLSGLCVAATREVRSVLLVSRRPPERIERLAVDRNSRTSAALVRILLKEKHGIEPVCVEAAPDLEAMMRLADAALVIGDPALGVDRRGYQVLDLAEEWHRLTGRPFVFAVWALRPGVDLGTRQEVFYRSLLEGKSNIDHLVEEAVEGMGMDRAAVHEYLTECLTFDLRQDEREGLETFFTMAHRHGLIPSLRPIRFSGTSAVMSRSNLAPCCDDRVDSVE